MLLGTRVSDQGSYDGAGGYLGWGELLCLRFA